MRTNEPKPVMILERGQCKPIREATCDVFECPQKSLPGDFKILLCLLDGASRRQKLMTDWTAQDDPSQECDSDEGLELILRRELIDIACFKWR